MAFAGIGALTAALLGLGALRVRGLLLAVTTFAFGVACTSYLYARPFFQDSPQSSTASFPVTTLFGPAATSAPRSPTTTWSWSSWWR